MKQDTPILIWGAGAMGATLGAYLLRAGHAVRFVDANPAHVAALRDAGLHISGPILQQRFDVDVCLPEEVSGRYPLVLLATKAVHTRAACRQIQPHLAEDGVVVSVQNGLNERVIAEVLGDERTFGCFVNFGADLMAPGEVTFGGWGATVVGEIDSHLTARARAIHALFSQFNPAAVLTGNIHGYLWGKLVYGAILFASATTNEASTPCWKTRATVRFWSNWHAKYAAWPAPTESGWRALTALTRQPLRPKPRKPKVWPRWMRKPHTTASRSNCTPASGAI